MVINKRLSSTQSKIKSLEDAINALSKEPENPLKSARLTQMQVLIQNLKDEAEDYELDLELNPN